MYDAPPPPYKDSKKSFPRKTFKGIAGATIALGIICVIIGISEGIYSVTSQKRCNRWARNMDFGYGDEFDYSDWYERNGNDGYYNDAIYPDDEYVPRDNGMDSPDMMSPDDVMEEGHDTDQGYPTDGHDNPPAALYPEDGYPHIEESERSFLPDRKKREVRFQGGKHGFFRLYIRDWSRVNRCATLNSIGAFVATLYFGSGILFIITGSLGVGAARTAVSHRRSGLKTGYIVMNILNVLSFAPSVFVCATAMAWACSEIVPRKDYWKGHRANAIIMSITGLATGILSLVASAIACCCSPTSDEDKAVPVQQQPVQQQMSPAVPAAVQPQQQVAPTPHVPVVLLSVNTDEKAELISNEASQA